jgi:hypothetical protein
VIADCGNLGMIKVFAGAKGAKGDRQIVYVGYGVNWNIEILLEWTDLYPSGHSSFNQIFSRTPFSYSNTTVSGLCFAVSHFHPNNGTENSNKAATDK